MHPRLVMGSSGSASALNFSFTVLQMIENSMLDTSNCLLRKLAVFTMCCLMSLQDTLPMKVRAPMTKNVNNFQQMAIGGGKVALNKLPETLVFQLKKDPALLKDMHGSNYGVDDDLRIWSYP